MAPSSAARRAANAVGAALLAALLAVGCGVGGSTRYEDCEVSDQQAQEADCGFWTFGNQYRLGARPGPDWRWVWWEWVVVGQDSFHDDGWEPPHGLEPPEESDEAKARRTNRKSSPPPAATSTKPPKPASGNQGFKDKDTSTSPNKKTSKK